MGIDYQRVRPEALGLWRVDTRPLRDASAWRVSLVEHQFCTKSRPSGSHARCSKLMKFKMVRENYETTKLVLDFFVKMGDRMPRFESLATTFNHSKLVTNALENVYEAMLEFWTPAFKFYNSK